MTKSELLAQIQLKLDLNKDGKANIDDFYAYVAGNVKKAAAIGLGTGLAAGIPIGFVLKMIVS